MLFTGSEQTRSSIRVTVVVVVGGVAVAVVVVAPEVLVVVVCAHATDGTAKRPAVAKAALTMCMMCLPLAIAPDVSASP